MSRTNETTWTNMTIDVFRDNPHIDCKPNGPLLKRLTGKTLEVGIRFVSQQSRPTEGVRSVRLDAWKYIRRVSVDDMIQALQDLGYLTRTLREQVRTAMEKQSVYHVAIRGNDPNFMPFGKANGQDIPTSYFLEGLDFVHEEVDKLLFDELENPDAIRAAMSDPCFDQMLEHYFLGGDPTNEENLHVVSRFNAGANLLHTCIKEGHVETLKLFLESYTFESHGTAARWRVLAEPLRPCGKFKCSAFHRAVFDGRSESLRLLVDWAQVHGHDITRILNVEERNGVGEAVKGLTCLELAEQEGNHECFNILAPLFGVPVKESSVNATSRETRLAARVTPRVELFQFLNSEVRRTVELDTCDISWEDFLRLARNIRNDLELGAQDLHSLGIRVLNVNFLDDATEGLLDELFSLSEGMYSIEALSCTLKTERACANALRVLLQRLSLENVGDLPPRMPSKIQLPSSIAEDLSAPEEKAMDAEVARLMCSFIRVCGRWPRFLGAPFLISSKQLVRIKSGTDFEAMAACHAARYASRLSCFLFHNGDVDADDRAGMEGWLRNLALMPLARSVSNFFSPQLLLSTDFQDPSRAFDASVIPFLQMVLSAWFSTAPQETDSNPWSTWAQRLGVSETAVKQELTPALDNVLESLLRMWSVLDPLCKHPKAEVARVASIGELMWKCIPSSLLGRLPRTRDRLERYYGSSNGGGFTKSAPRVALLSMNTSLRPGGGGGKFPLRRA